MNICVLYGGKSGEHEVSLRSAASVVKNLDPSRYSIVPVGIDRTGKWHLQKKLPVGDVLAIEPCAKPFSIVPGAGMFIDGEHLHLACAVEPGHVLRVMRPGDLIGTTKRDLALAADKVGGSIAALLAFSCLGRHWEAQSRHLDAELARTYAAYATVGFQSFGEQSGMLLVNHTLTGLAIGGAR